MQHIIDNCCGPGTIADFSLVLRLSTDGSKVSFLFLPREDCIITEIVIIIENIHKAIKILFDHRRRALYNSHAQQCTYVHDDSNRSRSLYSLEK